MSKLADAAFEWLKRNGHPNGVSTKDLWNGMRLAYPELTASSEIRKTPRNTLIRDLRLDPWERFSVNNGHVAVLKPEWQRGDKTLRQRLQP